MTQSSAQDAGFEALQEWEGCVGEVSETHFIADLVDLTAGSSIAEEEATIPRTQLSEADNASLQVGSMFRWTIGYERSPAGRKTPVSRIALLELPPLSERDLREAEAWARKMARAFNP